MLHASYMNMSIECLLFNMSNASFSLVTRASGNNEAKEVIVAYNQFSYPCARLTYQIVYM